MATLDILIRTKPVLEAGFPLFWEPGNRGSSRRQGGVKVQEEFEKPLGFSETVGARRGAARSGWRRLRDAGGRPGRVPDCGLRQAAGESPDALRGLLREDDEREPGVAGATRTEPASRAVVQLGSAVVDAHVHAS
jgi:hypothetical protein